MEKEATYSDAKQVRLSSDHFSCFGIHSVDYRSDYRLTVG